LIGKLEIIGEWTADGSLEEVDERRVMNVKQLNEAIRKKLYELDVQLLLAGLMTILGIHKDGGEKRFTLEVHVPLFLETDEEYDVAMLERRAEALRSMRDRGYYLEGHRGGYVKCFLEGGLSDLEGELEFIESALA
jgi:hypothetical protein